MITIQELHARGIYIDCLRFFLCPNRPLKDPLPMTIITRGALYIPENATHKVKDLVNKIIFDSCTRYIGDRAFYECTKVKTLKLPEGLLEIGEKAFQGLWRVPFLKIPSTVVDIGKGAFSGMGSLSIMSIPSSLKIIREETFLECYSLLEVNIPSSVKEIRSNAFKGCSGLSNVYLSKTTKVATDAFSGCPHVKFIYR